MLFANDFINTEDIMDWIKVSIFTTSEGIEPLSGRLYQLGITGLEIEDKRVLTLGVHGPSRVILFAIEDDKR